MIAYKAFSEDLSSRMGKKFVYEPGKKYKEDEANRYQNGFHCCENPLDCFNYYGIHRTDRYFEVEIGGDMDEVEGDSAIAATEIRLLKELTLKEMVEAGIEYELNHPGLSGTAHIKQDTAEAEDYGIAIAKGANPKVKGGMDSVIAMIWEQEGVITGVWIGQVDGKEIEKNQWYQLEEVQESE